jgi:hypothetical protein
LNAEELLETNVRRILIWMVITLVSELAVWGEQFATFPEKRELPSPDGRYVIRNVDANPAPQQFSGVFHSLFLEERATGRSRKLCDYVRRVAVAWSAGNRIIVTDYTNQRNSRVLVFAADESFEPVVIDKRNLEATLPDSQRVYLSKNDHAFVEASSLQGDALVFRVWGYGAQNANGFRLICQYDLAQSTVSCGQGSGANSAPVR